MFVGTPNQQTGFNFVGAAFSQEEAAAPERKTRRTPTMRQAAFRKLEKAQIATDEGRNQDALEELEDLRTMRNTNSYELAMMWNLKAAILYGMEDIPGAINGFEQVLLQEDLPLGFEDNIRYQLAQLHFMQEDYQKTLDLLEQWLKFQPNPPVSAYNFKGQAHYALNQYQEALVPFLKAVEVTETKGEKIPESLYLFLRVIYFELKNYPKVRDYLELLLKYYPKASYWLQLASIYSEMDMEAEQLASMEVAYKQGFLDKDNYLTNMAQLYLYNEVPIKAAWVMEKGYEDGFFEEVKSSNYETFSQAYILAKEFEKAISPLEKAAEMSDDGKLYVRLASVYLELDDSPSAIEATKDALKKGDLDREDQAYLSLGMAYYNNDQLSEARDAFREARKDKRSRKVAANWIKFLTGEMDRRKALLAASRE